jgi:PKD repeat protein
MPAFAGNLKGVLAMPEGGGYVYLMTQYGVARASIADPSNPGPVVLAQVGHKSENGQDNGGKVPSGPALCDCYQGPSMFDAAEAPDGSARMIMDFDPRFGGVSAEVASADAANTMAFGQQVNIASVPGGSRAAALYLSSGKFIGYVPIHVTSSHVGVAVVNMTTVNGNAAQSNALPVSQSQDWGVGAGVLLRAARVGGLNLVAGAVPSQKKIRMLEVDGTTGALDEKASVATTGAVLSLWIAAVNGRTFVFSAESTSGLRIYEYAGGSLSAAGVVPLSNADEVVVSGGALPLIFVHNALTQFESYVEVFDTAWITQGGSPRQAAHLRHHGAAENFVGKGIQAFVSGNSAYVYRIAVRPTAVLHTTKLDISCISISPTSAPIASSLAMNLSAAARTGVERSINYYGDKWDIQDTSASSSEAPANGLDQIEWDWYYDGAFQPDETLPYSAGAADVKPAYFPCRPPGGDIRTGAGCAASLPNPSASAVYRYALRTRNGNGLSAAVPSSAVTVVPPQVRIAGLDTSVSPAVLQVLSGGQADASGSQGNINDAGTSFAWTFSPGGAASGKVVNVPSGALAFALTITYPGGYTATQNGKVTEVDLVPDFSPTSGTVSAAGSLPITNKMQKATVVTVTSVEYAWDSGAYTALPSGFNAVNGTASVPSPGSGNNHTLKLRYNFTKSGAAQAPMTVSHGPFNVSTGLIVTLTGAPNPAQTGQRVTFTATASGGSAGTTFAWCWEACGFSPVFVSGPATNSHTFTSSGTKIVVVEALDGGATGAASFAVTVSGPCTSCGGPTVSLSGPATGVPGSPVTFTANASGGTGPYTYGWRWGDSALPGYVAGPQTNSHAYTGAGKYTVSVQATDGASRTATKSVTVTIGGGGGKPVPSGQYSVDSGATINPFNGTYQGEAHKPITLTAAETHASTYAWDFDDGSSASTRSVVKVFDAAGSYDIKLTVTGDDTNTAGTASSTTKFLVGEAQFSAVVVPDAAAVVTTDGVWKTDVTVTNVGPSTLTIAPVYRTYESLVPVPPSTGIDVTALEFDSVTKYTIAPGGSWSQEDVVGFVGGTGKGNLFFKIEGGPPPEVAARVYFAPTDPELGTYGNAIATFQVGAFGQVGVQQARSVSAQTILGVRSDEQFRFKVKLYNSSGQLNGFRLQAFDETGAPVPLLDGGGLPVASLDFGIGAYQAAELGDDRLGLTDPAHRYVLQAEPLTTGAMLVASASIIDRTTNDQVQVADDATRPGVEEGAVRVFVPAVSRLDTAISHWRTSVSILNSAGIARGVLVEYLYGPALVAQSLYTVEAGKLLSFDDISEIFPNVPEIAVETGTAGLLKISYAADAETPTRPVLVSARSYDDRSTTTGGTAGTALSSYSGADATAAGEAPIVIPGAETNDRFRTNVGIFALDDETTTILVTAVDKDGNVVGTAPPSALNIPGQTGPWLQFPIALIPGLPAEPVSLRVEVTGGGRIGAYAINIDQKSADTTFIKGTR